MIGVKPAFSGRSLGDGANADFDVVMVAPDGKHAGAKRLALRAAQGRDQLSVVPPERPVGIRAGQAHRRASPTARSMSPADKPARIVAAGEMGPLPPGSLDRRAERRR